ASTSPSSVIDDSGEEPVSDIRGWSEANRVAVALIEEAKAGRLISHPFTVFRFQIGLVLRKTALNLIFERAQGRADLLTDLRARSDVRLIHSFRQQIYCYRGRLDNNRGHCFQYQPKRRLGVTRSR